MNNFFYFVLLFHLVTIFCVAFVIDAYRKSGSYPLLFSYGIAVPSFFISYRMALYTGFSTDTMILISIPITIIFQLFCWFFYLHDFNFLHYTFLACIIAAIISILWYAFLVSWAQYNP